MTFSEEQVEWIVMEVIRRLGVAGGERSFSPVGGGELVIEQRVVTLRLVEGRLENVTRVVVRPRAVVTPAVKDELRARKIELAFGQS